MLKEDYQIWLQGIKRDTYPRAVLPTETEFLIIGGGITGITCAYLLAKENKKAILLEKRRLGEWVTDCTTGFLTGAIDTDPAKLIKAFGLDKARLIINSHLEAINSVEKIIKTENIQCDFSRCSNYFYANNSREEKYLQKLVVAYQKLGINAEYKKDNKLKLNQFGYVEMPNQAKFHVMKYVSALARLAVKSGAIIAEQTEVLSLEEGDNYITVSVKDAGNIKSQKIVSATYSPFLNPKIFFGFGNMYRSYVIEYKIPTGKLDEGTYQDGLMPYHYFRVDKMGDYDRLVIGGADHQDVIKMDREINYNIIRRYADKLFTDFKPQEIRYWSGLISETNDSLAYIGESQNRNIFYAFGFSGNGMTYSNIAGRILLDWVLGRSNPKAEIYKIDREISWWRQLFIK